MNDRQLRYAHAVWHERSFSRAALKMGVSQPSLSEQIRLLEEELGFTLFYRNSRGVDASANGQAFLESASGVVTGLAALRDLARELRGKRGGAIRIGFNSGLAQALLPHVVRTLGRIDARMAVELNTATTRRIARLVHQQRLDLGFIFEPGTKSYADQLRETALGDSEIVLLAPPDHAFAKRRDAVSLAEICRHPLIVNEPRMGPERKLAALFAHRKLVPEIAADCDDFETLKYMVRAGAGLALAPSIAVEEEAARGLLAAARIEGAPRAAIRLVRRPEEMSPRLERAFEELARELTQSRPRAAREGVSA